MKLLLFPIISLLFFFNKVTHSQVFDCRDKIGQIEKKFNLPYKLLSAISITETGRKFNGEYIAWPWALNVSGRSFYFENKNKAKLFLKKKITENKKNIDIGCMQINYRYHKKSFKNLENFIDPFENITWAARHLKELHSRYKSWNVAISRYHSSNPERMKRYLQKVKKNWEYERERKYLKTKSLKQKSYLTREQKKIQNFRKILDKSRPEIL